MERAAILSSMAAKYGLIPQMGAGIGGGGGAVGSSITINGGTVTAMTSIGGACIGGGTGAEGSGIIISGGSVYTKLDYHNGGETLEPYLGNLFGGGNGKAAIVPRNKNGTAVYRTTIPNLHAERKQTVNINNNINGYNTNDIFADGSENIYLYLPVGTVSVQVGLNTYTGTVKTDNKTVLTCPNVLPDGVINVRFGSANITSTGYSYKGINYTYTGDYTIYQSGNVSKSTTNMIIVSNGSHNITLENLNIDVSGTEEACAFSIVEGSVNIQLLGSNVLKSGDDRAGIENGTNYLTIVGSGELQVQGGVCGAGIGGGLGSHMAGYSGRNIAIKSGTVVATGGFYAAGIGGGNQGGGSDISIEGGTVTAIGGYFSAGIGGGHGGSGSAISIEGGTVTAIGGDSSAGIGGGRDGDGSNISIESGTVVATGNGSGAGIGGGVYGNASNISIKGGTVVATGKGSGAGIGAGGVATLNGIVISGGSVKASGGNYGPAIGSGGNIHGNGVAVTPKNGTSADADDVFLVTKSSLSAEDYTYLSRISYTMTDANAIDELYYLYLPKYPIIYRNAEDATHSNPNCYGILDEIALADASKANYRFVGWYDAETGGNKVTSIEAGSTGGRTLYAHWTIETNTVTFDPNGGTRTGGGDLIQTIDYGGTATEPTLQREGYTFDGWNAAFNNVKSSLTVTAQWTVSQYNVSFNSQGGSLVSGILADFNTRITAPADPTRIGYSFGGWYKEAGCLNAWDFTADTVTENRTLYAKWGITSFTVKFLDSDGTELSWQTVEYGSSATAPDDPDRAGHTFTGWDKAYNPITGDTVITAQYIPAPPPGTAPTINTPSLDDGMVGITYRQTIAATGDTPITWSLVSGSLPGGLTFASDGAITGAPTTAGTFDFTVRATNSVGSVIKNLSIVISLTPPSGTPPTITTTTLPNGAMGREYNQTLSVTSDTPVTWSMVGPFPNNGLGFFDGTISGTPLVVGTFSFTVKAENSEGTDTKDLSITIDPPTYDVSFNGTENGSVQVSPGAAAQGETVTLTIFPDSGYQLKIISVVKSIDSGAVDLNGSGTGTGDTRTFIMPDCSVSITVIFEPITATVSSVTVSPDNASVQKGAAQQFNATVIGTNNPAQTVTWSVYGNISNGTSINSSGVLTTASNETAGTLTVKATSTVDTGKSGTATVTVKASGSGDGSGSGGSSDGNSGNGSTTTTITPDKKPDQPVIASTAVTATAGTAGLATVTVPDSAVASAITAAQTQASQQNRTANGIGVAVNITAPVTANSLGIALTQPTLQRLVSAQTRSFEVNGSLVSLNLDLQALQEIQRQSTGNVTITLTPAQNLSTAAQALIGTRPVYNVTITYVRNGQTVSVTNISQGSVALSIPYTPAVGEYAGNLYATYVDGTGKPTRIAGSVYDANSKSVIFTTNHFSVYGVGYTAPSAKFTDISTHWAKESIDYAVGRGLFSGTSDTTFAPNTTMTRGMLVAALGRLAGVDVSAHKTSSFTDVKVGSYYLPYVEWAFKKGIISGVGGNQFAPDRAITREEIAVILQNYAKATGYTLPVTRTAVTFADNSSISSWAKDAVKAMQQAGIMAGEQNNKLNPKTSATRAEVATALHRYVKLTIDPATAQGWAKNDDGQWLYYKDSKALTGWQTIGEKRFNFDAQGILQTGWVKDGDNWYYFSGNIVLTGWWDIGSETNKKRYYFTVDAIMVSGKWLQIDGKWYYFNADGSLAVSMTVDGYKVDENGVRK